MILIHLQSRKLSWCLSHTARANAHKDTMGPRGLWAENEEEYAQQLKRLFASPDLRQSLAEKGARWVRESYGKEKALSHIESIYANIYNKNLLHTIALQASIYTRIFFNLIYVYYLFRILKKQLEKFCLNIIK